MARPGNGEPHGNQEFSGSHPEFCQLIRDSPEKRHMADYDPLSRFARHEVLTAIDLAEDMIRELQAFNIKDKRAFSVWITMKNRAN